MESSSERLFKSVVNAKFLEILCVQVFCQVGHFSFLAVDSDSTSVLLQKTEIDSAFFCYPPSDLVGGAPGAEQDKTYIG